jgi:two-component system, NarL family, nitrate/nitrite response regulator NarL
MSTTQCADVHTALLAASSAALRRRWAEGLEGWPAPVEAADRGELEERMLANRPAVVFLDLALPGLSGLDGVPDIQRLNPGARLVLLASSPSERQAVFALVAGARGYCDRNIAPSQLKKAVEVVQRGEIWIGRHVVPHLLRRITSLTPAGPDAGPGGRLARRFEFLAPREREIALLVGSGANNREIAERLSITESTVKAHLTSVFRKLDVPDRLRLALVVRRQRAPMAARRAPSRGPRRSTSRPADA